MSGDGTSDGEGRVQATLAIPAAPGAETAVLCQAEAAGTNSELKRLVRRREEDAAPPN